MFIILGINIMMNLKKLALLFLIKILCLQNARTWAQPSQQAQIEAAAMKTVVCEQSCEDEWPRCVGATSCENCKNELKDGGSRLVTQGGCTVGCSLTVAMKSFCGNGPVQGPTKAPSSDPGTKPIVPTLCNNDNKGSCECGEGDIKTYVFWPGGTNGEPGQYQRCIHTYIPSSNSALPVVISVSAYGQGLIRKNSSGVKGAKHYGYALFGIGSTGPFDQAGNFGLEFPANGIVNPDNPTPCASSDSRDFAYIEETLAFIDGLDSLDSSKVFLEGFSQNSMFAAYISVCFADKVKGLYQGGSGLALTGHTPITPGWQAQCSLTDYLEHKKGCCEEKFCTECTWWPVYPRTCEHKLIDCIASYTNDNIACGSDWYMYEAMVAEGNDARLLSFSPPNPDEGKHSNPKNYFDWIVGCLGVVESCSSTCEISFSSCVATGKSYTECFNEMSNGDFSGCVVGCAPTLEMLKLSELPVVTLSKGNFGTQTGLPSPGPKESAVKPLCENGFGPFETHQKCKKEKNEGPKTGTIKECSNDTEAPTPQPTSVGTKNGDPTYLPCKDGKKFFYKEKKSKVILKECSWLEDLKEKKKKKVCQKFVDFNGDNGPAQVICPLTCNSCDACYENEKSKFFFKYKDEIPEYKTCGWLQEHKKKKKFCKKSFSVNGYGPPKEVCPSTCEVC